MHALLLHLAVNALPEPRPCLEALGRVLALQFHPERAWQAPLPFLDLQVAAAALQMAAVPRPLLCPPLHVQSQAVLHQLVALLHRRKLSFYLADIISDFEIASLQPLYRHQSASPPSQVGLACHLPLQRRPHLSPQSLVEGLQYVAFP